MEDDDGPLTWRRRFAEWREARPRVWHWDRRRIVAASLATVFVVGAVGGATSCAVKGTAYAVSRVEDRFTSQVQEVPTKVLASSERKGFPAGAAADGADNTYWSPDADLGTASGEWWQATFDRPYRLTTLVLFIGAAEDPKEFLKSPRPTDVSVTAFTRSGDLVTKDLNLADQPGHQDMYWGLDDVVKIMIKIKKTRAGSDASRPLAGLTEVQFFTRK
ncbi:hypothetical protein I5Q34_33800 [Streptomyces sp. AV19]|uniref:NADase-type glycan-binding domain-containing protein n=1 Tax=Streptomyces sp. AV19 TaxID=2793068 RepID=UPI0018FE26FD|nr:hypothetical protein [Streptomyces sp. AV19]MBH1939176.1 hypothetical protein [Streptomyces sp. AV19]MDG4536906.1 hypothetical protein [Streptomyces sp. AV19]